VPQGLRRGSALAAEIEQVEASHSSLPGGGAAQDPAAPNAEAISTGTFPIDGAQGDPAS